MQSGGGSHLEASSLQGRAHTHEYNKGKDDDREHVLEIELNYNLYMMTTAKKNFV
jgi:hypothetical protein